MVGRRKSSERFSKGSIKKESSSPPVNEMDNTNRKRCASTSLEALEKELKASLKESAELKKRYKDITDRQQVLTQKNGGGDTKPSDIITLNVNGTEMHVRRDVLTVVKDSRLEALFSGRWENQLLRDTKGRVFMDLDPLVLRKILEYLYMLKLADGKDISVALPDVSPEMKPSFDQYVDFFALCNASKNTAKKQRTGAGGCHDNVDSSTHKDQKRELMAKTKAELAEMEKKLEVEESFVAYFMKDANSKNAGEDENDLDASEGTITVDVDTVLSCEKVSDADLGIMNLNVNGEVIAVKRSTLCFDPESKLAQDFSNDEWLDEHSVDTESGKGFVLMGLPTDAFKQMIHLLQRMSIAEDKRDIALVLSSFASTVNATDENYLRSILVHYFSAEHDIAKSIPLSIESDIIENTHDRLKIKEWLESVNTTSNPKLLYRASRDGWEAADFHRKCDNKGATLTVVKSTGGYIFGGYSSAPWKSNCDSFYASNNAFLFSLKCYEGLSAVKMGVTNKQSSAIYCNSGNGPTFGGGCDLCCISSNANTNQNSFSTIGNTYSLPPGTTNEYFLTGQRNFQVSEYEVFQV